MSEWFVDIENEDVIRELSEDFLLGPIVNDEGIRNLTEATVARFCVQNKNTIR